MVAFTRSQALRAAALAAVAALLVACDGPAVGRRAAPSESPTKAARAGHAGPSPTPESHGLGQPVPAPEPINSAYPGLTTFRGNATRTYYGRGPVPRDPVALWRFPKSGGMCARSKNRGEEKVWCGTGWTGQPNVIEGKDGSVEIRFGAYDKSVHFLNGRTGVPARGAFPTGDIIKGTVTSDPDGYPLLYTGSRDGFYHILALDRGAAPVELWRLSAKAAPRPLWNDDWDGSGLVIGDYLLEGGENSWFHVVKLNRAYRDGLVTVRPKIVAMFPGYDDQLLRDLHGHEVSIENSPAFKDGVVYFANSGGLVQGWDISRILAGGKGARRVFRFWTGDDTDASVVIDDEGFLYVASELERFLPRAKKLGQLMKLDPRKPDNPLVWSVTAAERGHGGAGGIWATPALYGDMLYEATNAGRLLAIRRDTGRIVWEKHLPGPTWSSPVVIDGTLIEGDCSGVLHAYDVRRPLESPPELWRVQLSGCIEATPAVWKGRIYVGTRGGAVYGIGDR